MLKGHRLNVTGPPPNFQSPPPHGLGPGGCAMRATGYASTNGDLDTRKREILSRLDVAQEYAAMGVEFTKAAPNADGWRACPAIGLEDRNPSAAVHVHTGWYKSFGEGEESLSFWDFALKYGKIGGDFGSVLKHFEEKAGAGPSRPKRPRGGGGKRAGSPTFDAAVADEAKQLRGK